MNNEKQLLVICVAFLGATMAFGCASDTLSNISPNKKFAVLSSDTGTHLVALPSRKVLVPDLDSKSNRGLKLLWSKDSTRFACSEYGGRFTQCRAFRLLGASFAEMKIPPLSPPLEIAPGTRVTREVGQSNMPLQWHNGSLVVETTGLVDLSDGTSMKYTYEFTIVFGKNGNSKVAKVRKRSATYNRY